MYTENTALLNSVMETETAPYATHAAARIAIVGWEAGPRLGDRMPPRGLDMPGQRGLAGEPMGERRGAASSSAGRGPDGERCTAIGQRRGGWGRGWRGRGDKAR